MLEPGNKVILYWYAFICLQEKETLQNTLQERTEEQKELWDKLQDITKIHSTVTESLQVR